MQLGHVFLYYYVKKRQHFCVFPHLLTSSTRRPIHFSPPPPTIQTIKSLNFWYLMVTTYRMDFSE